MKASDTKFLVNGKPMTNEDYSELMKQAREASKAYKTTDLYKQEQENKAKVEEQLKANIKKFEDLAKSLRLDDAVISRIGLNIYNSHKPKVEEEE